MLGIHSLSELRRIVAVILNSVNHSAIEYDGRRDEPIGKEITEVGIESGAKGN